METQHQRGHFSGGPAQKGIDMGYATTPGMFDKYFPEENSPRRRQTQDKQPTYAETQYAVAAQLAKERAREKQDVSNYANDQFYSLDFRMHAKS